MAAVTADRPFAHSPIVDRPRLRLPPGRRLAAYVVLNVEHYERGKPAISLFQGTAGLVPDVLNEGWREYGPRVGIWRLLDIFDRLRIPVTAALNSDVCTAYPELVREGTARGWAWVAHGASNTTLQAGMDEDAERAYLARVIETIEEATGSRPAGWLSPALTETEATLGLLGDLDVSYVLDWSHDDQPVALEAGGHRLLALPYAAELNDIPAFVLARQTGPQFGEAIVDAFDCLYAESLEVPRVFSLGLHPFLTGQPHRAIHLERALAHVAAHDDVWLTTADEVARFTLEQREGTP